MAIWNKFHFHLCLPPLWIVVASTTLNVENTKNRFATRCIHMTRPVEKCQNPWKSECRHTDIEVYIIHEEQQLPICTNCWRRIADENHEWRR